jgi:hypothetical protein
MNILAQLGQEVLSIERTRFSNLRLVIDKRNAHPFAVKHRLQFFASKANRHLETAEQTKHTITLRVHRGKNS